MLDEMAQVSKALSKHYVFESMTINPTHIIYGSNKHIVMLRHKFDIEKSIAIPSHIFKFFKQLADLNVSFGRYNNDLVFKRGNITLVTTEMDDIFENVNQVIKEEPLVNLNINEDNNIILLDELDKLSIPLKDLTKDTLEVTLLNDKLTMTTYDFNNNKSTASIDINCEIENEPITFNFYFKSFAVAIGNNRSVISIGETNAIIKRPGITHIIVTLL